MVKSHASSALTQPAKLHTAGVSRERSNPGHPTESWNSMTDNEIKHLVEQLILSTKNLGEWRYEIGSPEPDHRGSIFRKLFIRWLYPDGSPLDGLGVVIVDCEKRRAAFLSDIT